MKRMLALMTAVMALVLSAGTPARADVIVGADVHGWFSGASEVWAGKFPVDFTLNYLAHQIRTTDGVGLAPGFVEPFAISFDVRDPSGHTSSTVSLTYQSGLNYLKTPIGDYGPLDPYEQPVSRPVRITVAANAVGGTWHITPHIDSWQWELNGAILSSAYTQTIDLTEDAYAFTVHPVAAPATTTTHAPAPRSTAAHSGTAVGAAIATPSAAAPGITGASPDVSVTEVIAPPAPEPAQVAAAQSVSLAWPAYLVIALLSAALFGSLTLGGVALFRRRPSGREAGP